jgi:hypothetical protein
MAAPSHSVLPRPEPVYAISGHLFCRCGEEGGDANPQSFAFRTLDLVEHPPFGQFARLGQVEARVLVVWIHPQGGGVQMR